MLGSDMAAAALAVAAPAGAICCRAQFAWQWGSLVMQAETFSILGKYCPDCDSDDGIKALTRSMTAVKDAM